MLDVDVSMREALANEIPETVPISALHGTDEVTGETAEDDEEEEEDHGELEEVPAESPAADEDGGDEDDGDDDEETYVVQKILKHSWEEKEGVYKYYVKWQGYDNPTDNTWEPEENLEGAKVILQAYWRAIGGKPQPPSTVSGTKKRGRPAAKLDVLSTVTKKLKTEATSSPASERRGAAELSRAPAKPEVVSESWKAPMPGKGAWEDIVSQVETIEIDDAGRKIAFLRWIHEDDSGRKRVSRVTLKDAHKSCPQKMLAFYEQHLSVKKKPTTQGITEPAISSPSSQPLETEA